MAPTPDLPRGEVLKLGPPLRGELTITVDPERSGSPFAMGTLTLPPGVDIPLHRYLSWDEALFVHRGQGRAVLDGTALVILPGMTLRLPRQSTLSVRNTGTGFLELTWVAAPPGIEAFFRELSTLGGSGDASALVELGRRHGVEFPAPGPLSGSPSRTARPPRSGGGRQRRHRRRGGRGRGRGAAQGSTPRVPPAPRVSSAPRVPPPPRVQPAPPTTQPAAAPQAPSHKPSGESSAHVKEVFMSGRWVRVAGEGPVIAPGRQRSGRGPRRRGRQVR